MNFDEYEQSNGALYREFADLIRSLLKKVIVEAIGIPRPQSTQARAKSPTSLRAKLEERDQLPSNQIENEIKDLAGVRLIFYTNTDVDRFLKARLIPENFYVHPGETKIHHPTDENDQARYQAIHYVVSLSKDRIALPEYRKFADLRCEIQIQTILNHAWSETTHDMIYKARANAGFGAEARKALEKRVKRIMDDYLRPAGYEFQKAQHDYERLMQGKALFDRDVLATLQQCGDNNERHEVLTGLAQYVLPNYDDVLAIFPELLRALGAAILATRSTPAKQIESPFGNFGGKTVRDVITVAIQILETYRYFNIEGVLRLLITTFRDEPDPDIRKQILQVIGSLAKFDLEVWEKVGPSIQLALAEGMQRLSNERFAMPRPIALAVWVQLLSSDLGSTTFVGGKVRFSRAAVLADANLRTIRNKAIEELTVLFDEATSDNEVLEAFSALRTATYLPSPGGYTNELLRFVLEDTNAIARLLADRAPKLSFEFLQHAEHQMLFDYRRADDIADDAQDRFGCRETAVAVMKTILACRDAINASKEYVRYKTLVGFESTFQQHWEDDSFDYEGVAQFRLDRVDEFVQGISTATVDEWYASIKRCAETESDDLATFPVFHAFLQRFGKVHPGIAIAFIGKNDPAVLKFLPSLLNGLAESDEQVRYLGLVDDYIAQGRELASIARHCCSSNRSSSGTVKKILTAALARDETIAVFECLIFAIERSDDPSLVEEVFVPALRHAIANGDARWVFRASFRPQCKAFFPALSPENAKLVLSNFLALNRIEHNCERLLTFLASGHPAAVWSFLQRRCQRRDGIEVGYEALPFRFYSLQSELAKDLDLAVATLRKWHADDDALFRFTGGRLLRALFPAFTAKLGEQFSKIVPNGSETDINFILQLLENYVGEPETHETIKRIIDRLPENHKLLSRVDICLSNAGVVWGELGMVNAYRGKKAQVSSWLDDPRLKVTQFAAEYIRRLEQRIASEQRSAEADTALRFRGSDEGEAGARRS